MKEVLEIPNKAFVLDTNVLMVEPLSVYPLAGAEIPKSASEQLSSIGLDVRVEELHARLALHNETDKQPNAVVISSILLEELDGLKQARVGSQGRARIKDELRIINARKAIAFLNELVMDPNKTIVSPDHVIVTLENGGQIHFVSHDEEAFLRNLPPFSRREPNNDNRFVGLAYRIKKLNPDNQVTVISNDNGVRTQAELSGLGAETLRLSEVSTIQLYTGFNPVTITAEEVQKLRRGEDVRQVLQQEPGQGLKHNQFLEIDTINTDLRRYFMVKHKKEGERWVAERLEHTEKFLTFLNSQGHKGNEHKIADEEDLGRKGKQSTTVEDLQSKFQPEKQSKKAKKQQPPEERGLGSKLTIALNAKIIPEKETLTYLEALLDPSIPVVSCRARAGAGKTYWAAVAALYLLDQGVYHGVKYVRPIANIGSELGALPGGIKQKYGPWTAPFRLNLLNALCGFERGAGYRERADARIKKYYSEGWLEDYPTNFLAGVTFTDEIVLVDEAQYLTREQARMLIGRIGKNCKMVFIGDLEQTEASSDVWVTRNTSGFAKVIDALSADSGNPLYVHTTLSEIKRSPAAELERYI